MNKYSINLLLILILGSTLFAQDLTQPFNSESDQSVEETELTTEQSSTHENTLGKEIESYVFKPDYTLIRFTNGGILDARGVINVSNGDPTIYLYPNFYIGKAGTYSVNGSANSSAGNYKIGDTNEYGSVVTLGLGSAEGSYMVSPGHILYLKIDPTNLWFGAISSPNNTDTHFGTERPAETYNTYGSNLLINNGEIEISSPDYQLAFYHGPMLNKMQYKHNVNIQHQWWDSFSLEKFNYSGELGILNNLSFGTTLTLGRNGSSTQYYVYDSLGNSQFTEKFSYDKSKAFRLNARTKNKFGMLSYADSRTSESKTDFLTIFNTTGSLITLSGGYLHGTRALTFANVNGNWDNYYDQTLGRGQILGTADLYVAPYMDDGKSAYEINAKLDGAYGISDEINAGAIYYRNGGRGDADAENTIIIKAAYCTVPLRDYGPGAAPILEYHYGKKPGQGEFKANAWLKLPIADNHSGFSYDQSAPQQELFKATATAGLAGNLYGEGSISYDNNEEGDNQYATIDVTGGFQSENSHLFISWSLEILEESNEFGALSAGARILF